LKIEGNYHGKRIWITTLYEWVLAIIVTTSGLLISGIQVFLPEKMACKKKKTEKRML
jgi:hypothetical protein